MKLFDVIFYIAVFSLILAVGFYCFMVADNCFEKAKLASTEIRKAIKTDMKIRQVAANMPVSYLESRTKAVAHLREKIKNTDMKTGAVILSAVSERINGNDLFERVRVCVKWQLGKRIYETYFRY